MNYIEGEPLHFDSAESQDEASAGHQMALCVLYELGCEYNIPTSKMRELCAIAGVNFNELQVYSGATT